MEDQLKEDLKISYERVAYLKMSSQGDFTSEEIQSKKITRGHHKLFFVYLYIGVAYTEQLLAVDTGSSLLWVHCRPCLGCDDRLQLPLYDPAESSTYADDVSCHSSYCTSFGTMNKCGLFDQCEYTVKYVDGLSQGVLGTERFATTDVVFGCSNTAIIDRRPVIKYNGLLGLGAGKISLISQKGSKFSYCIGYIYDERNEHTKLVFGEPLVSSNNSTPLLIVDGHYYVNLEGISVGDKVLDINPKELRRSTTGDTGGTVVDTGSTFNFLLSLAYKKLKGEIVRLLGSTLVRSDYTDEDERVDLCYMGIIGIDLRDFPVVTFHFSEGANMKLSTKNLFQQFKPHVFCLMIGDAEKRQLSYSVIGVRLQQFFYMAYDLGSKRISFERVDCKDIG